VTRIFARGRTARRTPGTMNKSEARYADVLAALRLEGKVAAYWFEAFTFKLAPDTRYTPDFVVMLPDGTLEIHEVKGHMEDDAWVKLKVAASLFPFRAVLVRPKPQREGGGFETKVVNPED